MRRIGLICVAMMILSSGLHAAPRPRKPENVPVVMLSDIHFDPFRDPSKFRALASAEAAEWPKILSAPTTSAAEAQYAAIEKACPVRGEDTPWELLHNSLRAAQEKSQHPEFVTVSGDLLSHSFDCRYRAVGGDEKKYSEFAAKTIAFVGAQVREAFAPAPVYIALGNNDSGCGDYRETPDSPFLRSVTTSLAAGVDAANRNSFLATYASEGDASIELPLQHGTRLLVMQDLFQSSKYQSCAGKSDASPASLQIAWLHTQLESARATGTQIWLMAHIPAGIDLHGTMTAHRDVCTGDAPVIYLRNDALAQLIHDYADVIRLVVFAHSHMDEMRAFAGADGRTVPVKLVASVSPVNGNEPAFTIAQVNTQTATIADYAVYIAPKVDGAGEWKQAYDFDKLFGASDYSGASLGKLADGFVLDPDGSAPLSQAYRFHFWPGDSGMHAVAFALVWKRFACVTSAATSDEYRSCLCGNAPAK